MFKDYNGLLDLRELINDKYGYLYDEENKKDFYEQEFVEIEGNGVSAMCWINIDGDEYLFKPMEDFKLNVLGELLSEKIAKELNIPCAEYRACTLGNQGGVLTKNILKENETMILGCEVFQKFFNKYPKNKKDVVSALDDKKFVEEYGVPDDFSSMNYYDQQRYLFSHLNNLEEVWSIISNMNGKDTDSTYRVVKGLENMLLFDLITLQGDRHVNNWAIIENDDGTYDFSSLFDNAISLGMGYFDIRDRLSDFRNQEMFYRRGYDNHLNDLIYQSKPNFTLSEDNNIDPIRKAKDNNLKVFDDFMSKSSEESREKAIQMVEKINGDVTDRMLDEIERENGFTINSSVRGYIDSLMDIHSYNLNNICNKYKGSEKDGSNRRI